MDGVEARHVTGGVRVGPLRETPCGSAHHDELRGVAEQDGCLLLRALLPSGSVLEARARVLEACAAIGWLDRSAPAPLGVAGRVPRDGDYDAGWLELQRRVAPLAELARLREDATLTSVLDAVLGAPPRAGRGDVCRVVPPGRPDLTTMPHQDHFYVGGDAPLWTAWIPLGDCPPELGGLVVLPGSHRAGLVPHANEPSGRRGADVAPDVIWAGGDYRCGDVLLFHGLTLHRALENLTPARLRLSADFRYIALSPSGSPNGRAQIPKV